MSVFFPKVSGTANGSKVSNILKSYSHIKLDNPKFLVEMNAQSKNVSSSLLCRDHNKVEDDTTQDTRKFTIAKKGKTLRFLFILVTAIQLTK